VYVPLIIIFIVMTYYITDKLWIKRLNLIIGYIGIFIALFISIGSLSDSSKNIQFSDSYKNIPFWFVLCLLLIMSFINLGCRLFGKYTPLEDIDKIGGFEPKPREVVYKNEVLDHFSDLYKKIELLETMIATHQSTPINGRVNKNKYIQSLSHMSELINVISQSGELKGNITYRQKFIDLLKGLQNSGGLQINSKISGELNTLKNSTNQSQTQLESIKQMFTNGVDSILQQLQKSQN